MSVAVMATSLLLVLAPAQQRGGDRPDATTISRSVARIETIGSVGTGFLVGADRVLTADHVVEGRERLTVVLDGASRPGTIIRRDPAADLALVDVESGDTPVLRISDTPPRVLDEVFAFGNPLGGSMSVSRGIVSAVDGERVQTDAAVNPGNSGGPLVNYAGEVVGLVIAKNSRAEGVSYAVPAAVVGSFLGGSVGPPESGPAPATAPSTSTPAPAPTTPEQDRPNSEPVNSWMLPASAVAALASVCALAVLGVTAIRRRRRHRIRISVGELSEVHLPAAGDRIVIGADQMGGTEGQDT